MGASEEAIYRGLAAVQPYHPANVSLFTDWNVQAGDIVQVKSDSETYNVPVYNMKLKWTGKSKVDVEATGNPEREPLPALKRREYSANSSNYAAQKSYGGGLGSALEKIANIEGIMYAAGLQIDPVTGSMLYATEQGANYALGASLRVQAGKIQQIVEAIGQNGEVTAGSVVLAINRETNKAELTINADKVMFGSATLEKTLNGIVGRLDEINAIKARFNELVSGRSYASSISVTGNVAALTLSGAAITLNGSSLTSHTMTLYPSAFWTVASDSNISLAHSHDFSVTESNGDFVVTIGAVSATGGSRNFKIADTTKYKTDVASAWTNAVNTVRAAYSGSATGTTTSTETITLPPGGSLTVSAQAKRTSAATAYTNAGTVIVNAPAYNAVTVTPIDSPRYFKSDSIAPIGAAYVPVEKTGYLRGSAAYFRSSIVKSIGQSHETTHVTGTRIGKKYLGSYKKVYRSDGSLDGEYYCFAQGDTTMYTAGSPFSCYDIGSSGTYYDAGGVVSCYISTTAEHATDTYYQSGGSFKYYDVGTKTTLYEAGTTVTRYELLSSSTGATNTYYTAGTPKTYYEEPQPDPEQ